MNHKRGRPKNRRAGCLLCKPHKMNGWNKNKFEVGRLRRVALAIGDLKEWQT